jgi:hypothetical protein
MEKIQRKVIEISPKETFEIKRIGISNTGVLSIVCKGAEFIGKEVNELEENSHEILINFGREETEKLKRFLRSLE